MPNSRQDREFKDIIAQEISDSALQSAIGFIQSNFEPDEVFTKRQLEDWAENNGYEKSEN